VSEIIEVSIDAARPLLLLKNGGRKMAYALVNALNTSAKAVQAAERARVLGQFVVRKREFILRQAAIIKFASVGRERYEASISVGQKKNLLLARFEGGGPRQPVKGRTAAVPIIGGPARPSFAQSVPDPFAFAQLQLKPVGGRSKRRAGNAVGQYKGAQRTFELPHTARAPEGGVFQRVGPGRGDIRLVYAFVRNQKPIDTRLRFLPTGRDAALKTFGPALRSEVRASFEHAFGIG
jgi:hypothetical protein